MPFKLPTASSRVAICGQNGSGKTRFGIWLFGVASQFEKRPNIIIDYKGDDLIEKIHRARLIRVGDVPKHPGLYVVRPLPEVDDEAVDAWLWKIWSKGNIGLFVDEGYMIPRSKAFAAILTQGRSLKIPTMVLTQRPVGCSRFVFTEANFVACFKLTDLEDFKTATRLTPKTGVWSPEYILQRFHSRWYDAANEYACELEPVPPDAEILAIYDERLKPARRFF